MTPDIAELRRLKDAADRAANVPCLSQGEAQEAGRKVSAYFAALRNAAPALFDEVESQAARIAALEKCLRECAEDLAAEVEARYRDTRQYPEQERRHQRDIEPVLKARALLEGECDATA